jgi:hypothetical protein
MGKPVFFPEAKTSADQEHQNHIEHHRGHKTLVGKVIATIQPAANT